MSVWKGTRRTETTEYYIRGNDFAELFSALLSINQSTKGLADVTWKADADGSLQIIVPEGSVLIGNHIDVSIAAQVLEDLEAQGDSPH